MALSENYFSDMRNYLQEQQERNARISQLNGQESRKRNATFLQIVKGVPMEIYTDSNGNVLDVDVCRKLDYKTRNSLYEMDKLVYEKHINGAFKNVGVESSLSSEIKGKPIDIVLESLKNLK